MKRRLKVRTRLARAGEGRIQFCGTELGDLLDDHVLTVFLLGIGARKLTAEQTEVMNALAVMVPVGDPRIWPLKIARLIGAYGFPFAAMGGATLFLDHLPLGPWPVQEAAEFQRRVMAAGTSSEERLRFALASAEKAVADRRPLSGFGVAGRERDERSVKFAEWYESRKELHGPHWNLFTRVSEALELRCDLLPNMGGTISAVGLDFGLEPPHLTLFTGFAIHWATMANAREALRESPEVLKRLPEEFVEYVGPAPRKSPRALAAEKA